MVNEEIAQNSEDKAFKDDDDYLDRMDISDDVLEIPEDDVIDLGDDTFYLP